MDILSIRYLALFLVVRCCSISGGPELSGLLCVLTAIRSAGDQQELAPIGVVAVVPEVCLVCRQPIQA